MSYKLNLNDDEKKMFAKLFGSSTIPGMVNVNDIDTKENDTKSDINNNDLTNAIQEIKKERDKCDEIYNQLSEEKSVSIIEKDIMISLKGKVEAYNNCLYILGKIMEE